MDFLVQKHIFPWEWTNVFVLFILLLLMLIILNSLVHRSSRSRGYEEA